MSGDALPSIGQLLELAPPAPVSYWPQTWGWVALGAVVLVLMVAGAWRGMRARRRNRYRREGLHLLAAMQSAACVDPQAARGLPPLLKRVGLSSVAPAERARVGALAGEDWMTFLQSGAPVFAPDTGLLLRTLAYAPAKDIEAIPAARLAQLFTASRHWMERHHVAA